MKKIKLCCLCLVPAVIVGLAGCDNTIAANSGYILQDTEVYPTVTAPYEKESKTLIEEYFAVEGEYTNESDEELQEITKKTVAQLFAYACYNEEYLDKYVYFSDQQGETVLKSAGSSTATKQDYKLIIHESETDCGYKYHYTIKNVDSATGTLSTFKSLFESCKLRFVEAKTNNLYRFEGEDVEYDGDGYLTCTWQKDSGQDGGWGSNEDEPAIVKRSGDKLTIDEIEDDIVELALDDDDKTSPVIHGNVNVLAEDIIKEAHLFEYNIGSSDYKGYTAVMVIDTDVANTDEASLSMLREANSSSDCKWVDNKLTILFQIWDNGLFYYYYISEEWEGTISASILSFDGSATSTTTVTYSYSDRDTDMTDKLAMLESAKAE